MPSEELFLQDIINAAESVGRFLGSVSEVEFLADELVQSAVLHKLTIVGETAARVTDELRSRHPEIPWRQIIGFRNIVVHAYFSINWKTVWTAATADLTALKPQIKKILETEFPDFELRNK